MRRQLLPTTMLLCAMCLSCSDDTADTSSPRSPAPTVRQGDTASGGVGPTQDAAPRYTDLSTLGEQRLDPGRYGFLAYGLAEGTPIPVIEVPAGFQAFRGFSVAGVEGAGFRALMAWTVGTVYRNPCATASGEEVGPRARDLVEALARQRLTTTTKPRSIRLGGQEGFYVEVVAPAGDGFARCKDSFNLWSNGEGNRFLQAPGQVDRLWILDTPGERTVLDATSTPAVNEAAVRQLIGMARSARFVPSPA